MSRQPHAYVQTSPGLGSCIAGSHANPVVLQAKGLGKRFGATVALDGVDLTLRAGEVHALMGQNGAGKSTLIKLLTGVLCPDSGCIVLDGRAITLATPMRAQRAGISTVYQEVSLCPNLSVAENLYAGRYPLRRWSRTIDWPAVYRQARVLLAELNLRLDVQAPLSGYPIGVQQMVAIVRAFALSARVLILDEPTSSLDENEVRDLFRVIAQLRARGLAIVFVTHFLEQVYAISDRISVLRNGRLVCEALPEALPRSALVTAMVGHDIALAQGAGVIRAVPTDAPTVLQACGLGRRGSLHPIDLRLRQGEVCGLGGLLGAGRTELARLLFGLDYAEQGQLQIAGRPVQLRHPAEAVAQGLALCPEERKTEGIFAALSVRENIVLALQARQGWRCFLPRVQQQALAQRLVALLDIKTAHLETPVGLLSGGNQQKVVLARWLATAPRVLILDEPTRGIDIAAKQDLMTEVARLACAGMTVLFISAEIEELTRFCDRIVVLRERRKAGELPGGCHAQQVLALIAGQGARYDAHPQAT